MDYIRSTRIADFAPTIIIGGHADMRAAEAEARRIAVLRFLREPQWRIITGTKPPVNELPGHLEPIHTCKQHMHMPTCTYTLG